MKGQYVAQTGIAESVGVKKLSVSLGLGLSLALGNMDGAGVLGDVLSLHGVGGGELGGVVGVSADGGLSGGQGSGDGGVSVGRDSGDMAVGVGRDTPAVQEKLGVGLSLALAKGDNAVVGGVGVVGVQAP